MAAFPERFWSVARQDALAALVSSPEGLSTAEAARRLAVHGRNLATEAPRRRILAKLGRRLAEPLVAILVIAAAVSGATGDWVSFALILLVLAASNLLDVFQEHRAETAAEALKRSVAVRCIVRRDGVAVPVAAEEIVPGDVVELRAGGLVPADGIVLASRGAHANQALLTGEPYPVEKRPGPSGAGSLAEAYDALFGGTALISGEATMLVVATGAGTRFGGIAAALRSDEPPNAFERGLHRLGALILRLTVFLLLIVLLAQLASGRPALDAFLFAVALAVGLAPELLPMVTTVTLSRGALRMAARQVVVKRLAVIHDLGAMDVLCTDKTGTLTEARITLVGHPGATGEEMARVLELAAVNSRFESGVRSPLDDAILARAAGAAAEGWTRIADVPFDFERRRVSVLAERAGRRFLIVKGAPEGILSRVRFIESADGGVAPLSEEGQARLRALHEEKAASGLRCLGVAWREVEAGRSAPTAADEHDLVFTGFCIFADPPKADAALAIARLRSAGVRVKIVSGDAAPALRHLVDTLGLPASGLLTGEEIARLSDSALAARVQRTDLFARLSPDQKTRIIRALQARGHVVGFLGDGINDAPAIRAADAGLSVEGATDVARAAADLILLAPDLGVIADGVAEGRRTYANIMKYVRMGTSSNFGNMLSTALASLFIPFLPLTPVQVLLNNLLYDLSETGIPFDAVDRHAVAQPHGWDMGAVRRYTLVMGPLSSVFDLATFAILLLGFHASPEEFRTAWFVESMVTQILVIFLIRVEAPFWKAARPHPALVTTSLGALAVALVLALSPLGGPIGFTALSWPVLLALLALSTAYLAAAEGLKRLATARPHGGARRSLLHGSPGYGA
ncbi:magnesium-translocating P-type ATPase [Roseomonas sp. E05]|uniref:magnesium-translocating P-type ATPase n=1 Tax=Roseomonas sp. E05 TaxID=3046310 RepID=UPI0024BAB1B3|nr:magnesium-translocating P-type ATPase [Roseomonas sp. E05]MDJ0389511.1 magnesium-translocating P-type ATPase [Roseomonas sp. E05]